MGRVGGLLDLPQIWFHSLRSPGLSGTQWPSASRCLDPSPERPLLTNFWQSAVSCASSFIPSPSQILTVPRTKPIYLPFPSEFNIVFGKRYSKSKILPHSQEAGKNVAKEKNHRLRRWPHTPAAERTMAKILLMETPWAQQHTHGWGTAWWTNLEFGNKKCSKISFISLILSNK